jgi:hypothetical protein
MNRFLLCVALSCLAAPGIAMAGGDGSSCAEAHELFSPKSDVTGDTSQNTNFIGGFGGVPSPGPDAAYFFVANGSNNTTIQLDVVGGWNAALVMTASPCNGNAGNPVEAGTSTTQVVLVPTSLTAGQTYFVYVTGNPTDNSGPSGAYGLRFVQFPVTLQSFSID